MNVALIIALADRSGPGDHHLQSVRGVPLLGRAIRASADAFTIDRVYVVTDSERIATVAESHSARVLRPPRNSLGESIDRDRVIASILDDIPDATTLALVSAAHPFLDYRDLDHAVKMVNASEWDAVISVVPDRSPRWFSRPDGAIPGGGTLGTESDPALSEAGAFSVTTRHGFVGTKKMIHGRIGVIELSAREAFCVTTADDLQMARELSSPIDVRNTPWPVDAVVSDFTGVYTDGYITVGSIQDSSLRLHTADITGASILTSLGVRVMALTPRKDPLIAAQAKKMGIDLVVSSDYGASLSTWLTKHDLDSNRVVYLGSESSDAACMEAVGWPVAVANAHPDAKRLARRELKQSGGHGALRELAELIDHAKQNAS